MNDATSSTSSRDTLVAILDDDVIDYSIQTWRKRNIRLYELLVERGLLDPELVSLDAHRYLTETLIHFRVGAATDPLNGGHVRAQNENVLHYGLAGKVSPQCLTVALEAGFFHDLNKAVGEPLRTDAYAVRDDRGTVVPAMTSMAQIVGLNHLGQRTHRALLMATRLRKGALDPSVAEAIDKCIVHHGLGSSKFIQDLIDGNNPWWGSEFVDPEDGTRRLVHPEQPPLTLESLIHDLADSTQQMQGGTAWLIKYPSGFWSASGRSYADMLSGDREDTDGGIPMSLRRQIIVETRTCYLLIEQGQAAGLIEAGVEQALRAAVIDTTISSRQWINDSPEYLAHSEGRSVYHDIARAVGITPLEALEMLRLAVPGTPEGDAVEDIIWTSGRRLDSERAQDLAQRIEAAARSP